MDEYKKEPSDHLRELRQGEIDEETYLERTEDDVVEVLTEEAVATAEAARDRERVNELLEDGGASG
jgi:hypothetical protein